MFILIFPVFSYSIHSDLTLDGFKNIFFWEYWHRMWGRGVGLFCLLPAIFFYARGMLTKPMIPRVGIYFSLIGCQGLLGWYMVKSGLKHNDDVNAVPRVSQYRLAAHLSSALVLYSLFLWSSFTHLFEPKQVRVLKVNGSRRDVALIYRKRSFSASGFVADQQARQIRAWCNGSSVHHRNVW